MIESGIFVSKANYQSRKNFSIESEILEKILVFDSSMLTNKLAIYYFIGLQSCYNRQLVNIREISEESVGDEIDH